MPIICLNKVTEFIERLVMAQAMHIDTIAVPTSMDKKTYSVSFKGLIAHLLDILFVDNTPRTYYSSDMSAHMQKDIGLYR